MNQRRIRRRLVRQYKNQFDNVYANLYQTAKMWNKVSLPIQEVKDIIEKCKVEPEKTGETKIDNVVTEQAKAWNELLTELFKTAKDKAVKMKEKEISISYLHMLIATAKEAFLASI